MMMRFYVLVLGLSLIPCVGAQADDFGQRFRSDVPSAFEDQTPDILLEMENFDPNAIEPAAGDEDEYDPYQEALRERVESDAKKKTELDL